MIDRHQTVKIPIHNKLVPIDVEIAELVKLLNQIDNLITLESCQGYDDWGYILFRYGDNPYDWSNLTQFIFETLYTELQKTKWVYLDVHIDTHKYPSEFLGLLWFRARAIPKIIPKLRCLI